MRVLPVRVENGNHVLPIRVENRGNPPFKPVTGYDLSLMAGSRVQGVILL